MKSTVNLRMCATPYKAHDRSKRTISHFSHFVRPRCTGSRAGHEMWMRSYHFWSMLIPRYDCTHYSPFAQLTQKKKGRMIIRERSSNLWWEQSGKERGRNRDNARYMKCFLPFFVHCVERPCEHAIDLIYGSEGERERLLLVFSPLMSSNYWLSPSLDHATL